MQRFALFPLLCIFALAASEDTDLPTTVSMSIVLPAHNATYHNANSMPLVFAFHPASLLLQYGSVVQWTLQSPAGTSISGSVGEEAGTRRHEDSIGSVWFETDSLDAMPTVEPGNYTLAWTWYIPSCDDDGSAVNDTATTRNGTVQFQFASDPDTSGLISNTSHWGLINHCPQIAATMTVQEEVERDDDDDNDNDDRCPVISAESDADEDDSSSQKSATDDMCNAKLTLAGATCILDNMSRPQKSDCAAADRAAQSGNSDSGQSANKSMASTVLDTPLPLLFATALGAFVLL
jgi:hypothetical protein